MKSTIKFTPATPSTHSTSRKIRMVDLTKVHIWTPKTSREERLWRLQETFARIEWGNFWANPEALKIFPAVAVWRHVADMEFKVRGSFVLRLLEDIEGIYEKIPCDLRHVSIGDRCPGSFVMDPECIRPFSWYRLTYEEVQSGGFYFLEAWRW